MKIVEILDNIVWNSLAGPHSRFALGGPTARRYAPGFSPILGFADPDRPDFASIAAHCQRDEHFYCDGWAGSVPSGWQIVFESSMFKMVRVGEFTDDDDRTGAIPLGPEHFLQAQELAVRLQPGPFGPRTPELGEYFGVFDGPRLIAMAGERFHAGPFREISGVCTDPEFQGRGLARGLVVTLARRQSARGEIPFLHVMRDNVRARLMYERLGFEYYRESVVRVVRFA
ncbi:MAG: GNAT family N-acetyltransferase [Capsulimonadales bacterium]|nr:GNAT family N-acetyltransferase [Capsulimonadales bacterium]